MRIKLEKFGKTLTSRSDGKEAFLSIRPNLDLSTEIVEIDFSGIITLSPGWAHEFFSALEEFYKGRIVYLPTDNLSVQETLKFLRKIYGKDFSK